MTHLENNKRWPNKIHVRDQIRMALGRLLFRIKMGFGFFAVGINLVLEVLSYFNMV